MKERNYDLKYLNFTRWRGYEQGFPPAFYSDEELKDVMGYLVKLDGEIGNWLEEVNASFTVNFALPYNCTMEYASFFARTVGRYIPKIKNVKIIVTYLPDRYNIISNFTLKQGVEIVKPLLKVGVPVKIKTLVYGKGFIVLTPEDLGSLNEEKLGQILSKSEEGIGVKTGWTCDVMYEGVIGVYNYGFNYPYWFWRYISRPDSVSGCKSYAPSENDDACDIHYERYMYFYLQEEEQAGLINFYGGKVFASNCGGTCGTTNTKIHGSCAIRYGDLHSNLYESYYYIYAKYTMTKYNGNCYYYCYCGCGTDCHCSMFQVFIADVLYVCTG